jgi:hypothetical protein
VESRGDEHRLLLVVPVSMGVGMEPTAVKIKLCGILESDQIAGRLAKCKDLPTGKPFQIGKHHYGLLPAMAHP